MQGARDQRFLLAQAQSKVLRELTPILQVVPQLDCLVFVRHGQDDGSLEAGVHLRDGTRVAPISKHLVPDCRYLLLFLLT